LYCAFIELATQRRVSQHLECQTEEERRQCGSGLFQFEVRDYFHLFKFYFLYSEQGKCS